MDLNNILNCSPQSNNEELVGNVYLLSINIINVIRISLNMIK